MSDEPQVEDALNYMKTLKQIGGVGISPVDPQIVGPCLVQAINELQYVLNSINSNLQLHHQQMALLVKAINGTEQWGGNNDPNNNVVAAIRRR